MSARPRLPGRISDAHRDGAPDAPAADAIAPDAPARPHTRPARLPAPGGRHDGFSPARQRVFLEALAASASVADAARAAGVSRTTAYRRRAEPDADAFRLGWQAALAHAFDLLADTAFERAVTGVEEPVFHRGEQIGTRTRHNDRLLMFLLRRREAFVPVHTRYEGRHMIVEELYSSRSFAMLLDRVAPGPTPGEGAAFVSTSSLSGADIPSDPAPAAADGEAE